MRNAMDMVSGQPQHLPAFGHLIIENEMFELYIQIKNDQDYQVL